jgi:hypothetical protein
MHGFFSGNLKILGLVTIAVGLNPLDCWAHGFESAGGYGCSSVLFVMCCVGSGL